MGKKKIQVQINEELLADLDATIKAKKDQYSSRSAFIEEAVEIILFEEKDFDEINDEKEDLFLRVSLFIRSIPSKIRSVFT